MDVSDQAAYTLLERIAKKAVAPFTEDQPDKTIGEHRRELTQLLGEAVLFVHTRRMQRASKPA
ncbi:MAG: hypothetical protein ACM31O_03740 [Bacteroidota bacterium]